MAEGLEAGGQMVGPTELRPDLWGWTSAPPSRVAGQGPSLDPVARENDPWRGIRLGGFSEHQPLALITRRSEETPVPN